MPGEIYQHGSLLLGIVKKSWALFERNSGISLNDVGYSPEEKNVVQSIMNKALGDQTDLQYVWLSKKNIDTIRKEFNNLRETNP